MRCDFNYAGDQKNRDLTNKWFDSIGTRWSAIDDILSKSFIEVELINPPSILEFFSQLSSVSISRITAQGITFCLTDIPLGWHREGSELPIVSDNSDGFLFCPMSNVKAINTFGRFYHNPKHVLDPSEIEEKGK